MNLADFRAAEPELYDMAVEWLADAAEAPQPAPELLAATLLLRAASENPFSGHTLSDGDSERIEAGRRHLRDAAFKLLRPHLLAGWVGTSALALLRQTVDDTGGLIRTREGVGPVADAEWLDLADAYRASCRALEQPERWAPDNGADRP